MLKDFSKIIPFHRLARPFFVLMSIFLWFGISLKPAVSSLRVCNHTPNLISVALGYREVKNWTSYGWWPIEGNTCATLLKDDLKRRFYYLYAETPKNIMQWHGSVPMCISNRQFEISGVNDCFVRGYQRAGFQEYDTHNQKNWTIQIEYPGPTPLS